MTRTIVHPELGEITLCRKLRIRRMVLSVNGSGKLRISYPYGISSKHALEFALGRREWIENARKRQAERNPAIEYTDGMRTRSHTLMLRAGDVKKITIRITDTLAIVSYPNTTNERMIRQAARKAYTEALRNEAWQYLPGRLAVLAEQHGLHFGKLRIKAISSKWGSCTACGDINLSLYLMMLPDSLIDYVLLHELCHTVHHNHSASFHAMLDTLCSGNEKNLRRSLNAYRPPHKTPQA